MFIEPHQALDVALIYKRLLFTSSFRQNMSCLPLPGSQSFTRHLCFQSVWAKEMAIYTVHLDAVEKAAPTTGSAGLEVLFFQLGEGLEEW